MSEGEPSKHDEVLFNMLKECKTLPAFLDEIFGFLQRRTDFYHIATDPNSPVGLPKGLAESLVKHTFLKWKPENKDEITIMQEHEIPPAIVEEIVVSADEELTDQMERVDIVEKASNLNAKPVVPDLVSNRTCTNSDFTNSECYNGAVFENYCWSQTIGDIDITVKVPENVKSKDLKVTILTGRISVKIKDEALLEGELCQKCKHNDAVWSLDQNKLQIHLDKCREIWWDCLVKSEDRLDLSKVDCSRPFEELPEEAQVKIEELGWNQERKRLGLPTSDEMAKQELLKKAWHAEGSPFSGPFDPSQVVFH